MAEPKIDDIRKLVQDTPVRSVREALKTIGLLHEMFAPRHAVPCPRCGNPCNPNEAGTHYRTGYRSPCPTPYLPGSWLFEEQEAAGD